MVDILEPIPLTHSSASTHPGKNGKLHRKSELTVEAHWESTFDPTTNEPRGSISIEGNTSPTSGRQSIALLRIDVRDFRDIVSALLAANRNATIEAFASELMSEDQ